MDASEHDFNLVFYRLFAAGQWTLDLRGRPLREKPHSHTPGRAVRSARFDVVGRLAIRGWADLLRRVSAGKKDRELVRDSTMPHRWY